MLPGSEAIMTITILMVVNMLMAVATRTAIITTRKFNLAIRSLYL
jgi:hypothetical protein